MFAGVFFGIDFGIDLKHRITMKFSIAVMGAPYSSQAPLSALRFANAVINSGHTLYRVFFYSDGVYNGNALIIPPQDEININESWCTFSREHDTELVVCIASALRRGMLNQAESDRFEKTVFNLSPEFTVSGLGQLIDAGLESDRLVTFCP